MISFVLKPSKRKIYHIRHYFLFHLYFRSFDRIVCPRIGVTLQSPGIIVVLPSAGLISFPLFDTKQYLSLAYIYIYIYIYIQAE